jgi:hypothetical protein
MGGVNPGIQLAAALDRRGVTVSVDQARINIHLGRPRQYIVVQGWAPRVETLDIGQYWFWDYAGRSGKHPIDDFEGAADAIEKFLRDIPGLDDTRLLYRMKHMGRTQEQEIEEILERGRKKNGKGATGNSVSGRNGGRVRAC